MPLKPSVLIQKGELHQKGPKTSLNFSVSDNQDPVRPRPGVPCGSCKENIVHVEYSDEFRKSVLKNKPPIAKIEKIYKPQIKQQQWQLNAIRKYPSCTFDVNTRKKIGKQKNFNFDQTILVKLEIFFC